MKVARNDDLGPASHPLPPLPPDLTRKILMQMWQGQTLEEKASYLLGVLQRKLHKGVLNGEPALPEQRRQMLNTYVHYAQELSTAYRFNMPCISSIAKLHSASTWVRIYSKLLQVADEQESGRMQGFPTDLVRLIKIHPSTSAVYYINNGIGEDGVAFDNCWQQTEIEYDLKIWLRVESILTRGQHELMLQTMKTPWRAMDPDMNLTGATDRDAERAEWVRVLAQLGGVPMDIARDVVTAAFNTSYIEWHHLDTFYIRGLPHPEWHEEIGSVSCMFRERIVWGAQGSVLWNLGTANFYMIESQSLSSLQGAFNMQ
jgi:hypothetical protein